MYNQSSLFVRADKIKIDESGQKKNELIPSVTISEDEFKISLWKAKEPANKSLIMR